MSQFILESEFEMIEKILIFFELEILVKVDSFEVDDNFMIELLFEKIELVIDFGDCIQEVEEEGKVRVVVIDDYVFIIIE